MARTTADVPPVIAGDYAKLQRPSAVAAAESDGYVKTPPMRQAQQKPSSQFGLPRSGKGMKSVKC